MNVYDEQHSEEREFWSDEPTRRITRPTLAVRTVATPGERRATDPFIARIGLLVTAGLIAIALVWAVRVTVSGDTSGPADDPSVASLVPVTAAVATAPAVTEPAVAGSVAAPSTTSAAAIANTTAAPPATEAPQALASGATSQRAVVPAVQAASSGVAAVPAAVPDCTGPTYKIRRGDAWILIAKRVKVSTKDLLAANRATARTLLYPGRTLCLPKNATLPAAAPATTAAPVAVVAQQPAPPPTVAQAAKPPAPATTAAPVQRSYTQAESVAIIREVWPDELEEKALAIAWRESNHQHTARNYCCHGLFQIYFNVHKGWLKDLGITSAANLYDPHLNARAALTLYMRAGGWGPWGG